MVDNHLLQKSIITHLRNTLPSLVTGVSITFPDAIKQNQYQNVNFSYPAIRVDVNTQTPDGDGTDHLKHSTVTWVLRIFSEYPSDFEANYILAKCHRGLLNKQIYGTKEDNTTPDHYFARIDILETSSAMRLNERLWVAEIFCSSLLMDYNFDL